MMVHRHSNFKVEFKNRSMTDLRELETEILRAVAAAHDESAIEAVRIGALGKQGSITAFLKMLGAMSPEERKPQGALINSVKDRVSAAIAARKQELKSAGLAERLASQGVDVTLPVREPAAEVGRVHPITQVTDEIVTIFADMGFAVEEGPDIEGEDYNFTKLNFPESHPARDMHDTFYFPHEARRLPLAVAYPYLACAGQDDAEHASSHQGHNPGAHLPQRQRSNPHAHVPSGGRPGDRQGIASGAFECGY